MAMRGERLSDFELCVMLAVARIGDEAYGVPIAVTIEERTGRSVAIGAVYVALARLAEKGYLSTEMSDPEPIRGGRSRRLVHLTDRGRRVLKQSADALHRMLDGVNLSTAIKSR